MFNEYFNRVIESYNFNDNVEYLTEFETIQPRNSFERVNRLYLMADQASKQVYYARGVNREQVAEVRTRRWHRPVSSISVSCRWRANGLQLARFLIWFWLPTTDLTIKSRDPWLEPKLRLVRS